MATSWRSDQTSTLNLIASYVPYTAPVYNIKFTLKKKSYKNKKLKLQEFKE